MFHCYSPGTRKNRIGDNMSPFSGLRVRVSGIFMEVIIRHRDGLRFEAAARGHTLTTDQPVESGGADTALTPPELMLASLGTCAGHYAVEYMKARGLDTSHMAIRVTAGKKLAPARLDNFLIEVDVPELEERHREGVLRSVKRCLIHNTLQSRPEVEVAVGAPATMV
jgi:uncharacterized OsmC-like protein